MIVKIKRVSTKVNPYALLLVSSFLILFLSYSDLPFSRYYDDIIAVILGGFALMHLSRNKFNKKLFCSLVCICFIGIFSNVFSGIVTNASYILNDLMSFLRVFMTYFGTIAVVNNNKNRLKKTIDYTSMVSKFFLVIAFSFGILNIFGLVNMYSELRFGIKNYYFVMGNASQFGVFVGVALGFILLREKKSLFYELIGIILLLMTVKGMSLIIAATYIVFVVIAKRKIRVWHLIASGLVLAFVLQFQIEGYILNTNSPRSMLLWFGVVTAVSYFPFGSGFATYGSNMAAVHYSDLYYQYGFSSRAALANTEVNFLNDVYLGMIFGQFGFIGAVLMLYILFNYGMKLLKSHTNNIRAKYMALACFASFCGMVVMAGSVKGPTGMIILMLIGIFYTYCDVENRV